LFYIVVSYNVGHVSLNLHKEISEDHKKNVMDVVHLLCT